MSSSPLPDLAKLESRLEDLVREAGKRALSDWRPGERTRARIDWKGTSPVTSADLAVDAMIGAEITRLSDDGFGPLHYHSEEQPDAWHGPHEGLTIVIDPIDGTRSFMEGRDDWCVSLGVLHAGEPVLGVLHVPARGEMFMAHRGGGARYQGSDAPCERNAHARAGCWPARRVRDRRARKRRRHRGRTEHCSARASPCPAARGRS